MAKAADFARRLNFIGRQLEKLPDLVVEANKAIRQIAVEAVAEAKSLTPTTAESVRAGWKIVETGSVEGQRYRVRVVNTSPSANKILTDAYGHRYRKAGGQFFTVLDALDKGTQRHDIIPAKKNALAFFFKRMGAFFVGTYVDHPGQAPSNLVTLPKLHAAQKAKNLRRRLERKARRLF